MDYRSLLNDKLVFGQFLRGLGCSTPRILAMYDGDSVQCLDKNARLGLESLLDRDIDAFCKDRFGQCGRCAFPLMVRDKSLYFGDERGTMSDLLSRMAGRHFVIQERISQHADLAALCPTSVNTIRLVTVVVDGEPRPLRSLLRIGNAGAAP